MVDDEDFRKPIRKTTHLSPVDSYLTGSWEALGNGAPVLVALAQISSQALVSGGPKTLPTLLPEAKAILFAAKDRGIVEIKGVHTAFEAPSRLLAVYIEITDEYTIAFRDRANPEVTVRFLDGFRQLCECGLIIHHLHRDFSLTSAGFALAKTITQEEVQPWLDKGTDMGLHD